MFTSRAFRLSAHALIWADPSLTLTSTALEKADIQQQQYKKDFLRNQSWPVLNGDLTFGGLNSFLINGFSLVFTFKEETNYSVYSGNQLHFSLKFGYSSVLTLFKLFTLPNYPSACLSLPIFKISPYCMYTLPNKSLSQDQTPFPTGLPSSPMTIQLIISPLGWV